MCEIWNVFLHNMYLEGIVTGTREEVVAGGVKGHAVDGTTMCSVVLEQLVDSNIPHLVQHQ